MCHIVDIFLFLKMLYVYNLAIFLSVMIMIKKINKMWAALRGGVGGLQWTSSTSQARLS